MLMVEIIFLSGNSSARTLFNDYRYRATPMAAASSDMADYHRVDPNSSHLNDAVISAGMAHPEEEYQGSKGHQL